MGRMGGGAKEKDDKMSGTNEREEARDTDERRIT